MNHENTKERKRKMLMANFSWFRSFVISWEKKERRTSNVQHQIFNFLLTPQANLTPDTHYTNFPERILLAGRKLSHLTRWLGFPLNLNMLT